MEGRTCQKGETSMRMPLSGTQQLNQILAHTSLFLNVSVGGMSVTKMTMKGQLSLSTFHCMRLSNASSMEIPRLILVSSCSPEMITVFFRAVLFFY